MILCGPPQWTGAERETMRACRAMPMRAGPMQAERERRCGPGDANTGRADAGRERERGCGPGDAPLILLSGVGRFFQACGGAPVGGRVVSNAPQMWVGRDIWRKYGFKPSMALVLKIVQCVWPLTEQARAENRAVCLAPH